MKYIYILNRCRLELKWPQVRKLFVGLGRSLCPAASIADGPRKLGEAAFWDDICAAFTLFLVLMANKLVLFVVIFSRLPTV